MCDKIFSLSSRIMKEDFYFFLDRKPLYIEIQF